MGLPRRVIHQAGGGTYNWDFNTVDTKQLLDEVFVISGIIKVEVSVVSRAEGRG